MSYLTPYALERPALSPPLRGARLDDAVGTVSDLPLHRLRSADALRAGAGAGDRHTRSTPDSS